MIPLPQPVYVVCNANGEFVGLYSTNEVAQRVAAYEGATVSECREVWEEVPPEVLEATKTFHITVNSQAVTTDKHELDYWDVVRLSHFGEEAVQKKRILTVVFSSSSQKGASGPVARSSWSARGCASASPTRATHEALGSAPSRRLRDASGAAEGIL